MTALNALRDFITGQSERWTVTFQCDHCTTSATFPQQAGETVDELEARAAGRAKDHEAFCSHSLDTTVEPPPDTSWVTFAPIRRSE